MNLQDRLQARSLLLDEVYLRTSKAEHVAEQEKQRADAAETRVKELEAENTALRGESDSDRSPDHH